jgi:hypothetical protein
VRTTGRDKETSKTTTTGEEDEGVQDAESPRDYTEVQQGANFLPNIEETATVQLENVTEVGGGKGRKGKRGSKEAGEDRESKFSYDMDSPDMRNAMKCGNCGNLMTQSEKVNKFILDDKEMPKAAGGKYMSKSPGAPEGKYMAPLCDDCNKGKNMGAPVDFKTAVVIRQSGEVVNVPVAEL